MRLFIASSFEPRFIGTLEDIRDYARANSGRDCVKWVEGRNFHVTYAFLGELPDAAPVARLIEAALDGCRPFRIVSGGLGAFPSSRNPKVLWLSVAEGESFLRDISGRLTSALAGGGIQSEDRFEPHVTLGRVKRPLPGNFFRRASDYARSKQSSSAVGSVELMCSALTPDGPRYSIISSIRLL